MEGTTIFKRIWLERGKMVNNILLPFFAIGFGGGLFFFIMSFNKIFGIDYKTRIYLGFLMLLFLTGFLSAGGKLW